MNPSNFIAITVAFASQANRLQWILWALIMSLIMGWVARSRMRSRPACCDQQLRHPVSTLIIGLAGFLLFAAIAVVSNVFANKTTSWWTTAIFVGFALLALPVVGDYFAARHESTGGSALRPVNRCRRISSLGSTQKRPIQLWYEMVPAGIAIGHGGSHLCNAHGLAGLCANAPGQCTTGGD
jgi:uncharacterized protein YacL